MTKPDLHQYLDVRSYLSDIYQFRKKTEPGFSYEVWTQEMGFRSRSYLRAIVIGEKPLHESALANFIKSLNLNATEIDYFNLLFRYSLAPTQELKDSYGRQLLQQWKINLSQIEVKDIESFLSDPFIPVLFTYFSFRDSSSDPEIICKALKCSLPNLRSAIKCLVWQKLIDGNIDEKGNIVYKTVKPYFTIPSISKSQYLKDFHREGLQLATQAIQKPSEERKYFSTFVAINETQLLEAQKLIEEFNQKLLAIYDSEELKEKKIYRFTSQIFPAT